MEKADNTNTDVRYEHSDVNARKLAWLLAGIIVTALILHGLLYFLYAALREGADASGRVPKSREHAQAPLGDQPRLQVDPETDLDRFRSGEDKRLTSYGWVDRGRGVVHIPIERAMQIIAERGSTSVSPDGRQTARVEAANNGPVK